MKTVILNKGRNMNELSVNWKTKDEGGKMTFIPAMLCCSDSLGPVMTVYNNNFNMGDHEMSKS
jgi:hypothetical protein